MRKFKLFLSLLMLMAFSLGNVWGASTTYVFNSRDWEATVNEEEANWTLGLRASGYTAGQGTQITTSGTGTNATSPISFTNISSIIVTYCTNSKAGNGVITMQVGEGDEQSFTVAAPSSNGTTLKTKEFKYDPNESGNVKITVTCTKNSLYIYSIEVITADVVPTCSTEVTITPGSTTHGTFSLSDTKVCGDGEGGEISVTDISADDGYAFDEITTTNGTVDNENKKVTGITANTTITVLFKELQKYTVSFNTGAGNPSQADITETTAGAGITLPDGPTPACSADGWTFAGWAAAAVASETTTAPTLLSGKYNPTDNVTLYAVYKRTEEGGGVAFARYEKVTSDPSDWSGKYLLAANTTGTTYYTFTGQNGSNNYGSSVEHTPGTTEKAEWEVVVAKTTNGYSIYHANSSKYLGLTASSNALYFNANFTAETYEWVLSSANGAQAYSYDTRYIECNTGSSYRVACYAGTQKRFYLYKRIEEAASTTYYLSAPTCCEKLAEIGGSVKSVDQTSVTLQWTKLENVDGTTPYEVVVSPNAGVSVGAINLEGEKAECAITNLACGTEYTFTIKANGATGYCDAEQEIVQSTSKYTITPNAIGGGLVLAPEATSVCNGTEITLTANTPDGSHEGTATIVITNESKEDVTSDVLKGSTLTMPAYNITITATYAEKSSPSVGVTPAALDFGTPAKGASTEPKTFELTGSALVAGTLTLVAPTGYTVKPAQIEVEAGSLAAQIIYVTPSTENAGEFKGNISISGAGVAETNIVALTMTVQETYTAKWFVNGEELTESTQTAVAGTDLIAPSNPTKLADDCSEMIFKGWAEAPIDGKQADAPAFVNFEGAKMPAEDVNYYAVFAKEVIVKIPKVKDYTHTIEAKTWDAAGAQTLSAVEWTLANDGNYYGYDATKGQQVGSGSAPATSMSLTTSGISGTINKVKIYTSGAKDIAATVAVSVNGESYLCDSKESATLTTTNTGYEFAGDEEGEIVISWAQTSSKGMYFKQMDVNYTVMEDGEGFSDYMTTCPSCQKVTLTKAGETNGTFSIKQSGIEVASLKTCEAVELTLDATPATGYALKTFEINGVTGATYNEGNGTISIPANATGELTVTAYFSQLNYTVTMKQTGGADATISADQIDKHYGDEITVSAEDKDGFVFLNWEATPAVEFANAKALETTFAMPANDVTVTAKFTKILTIAEAADLIDADHSAKHPNSVVEGYIAGNISYNKDYHSITYNIQAIDADGFLSGKTIKVYSGKGLKNEDFASEDDVKVGAKVRVLGELMWYSKEEVYEINYNNYQLSYVEATNPSVVVYGDATKTAYEVGDDFDFTGLSAKTVYDNGYATAIAEPEWTADPETIAANTESVSVTANGSSAKEVNVTVNTHAITIEAPTNGTLAVKNGEEAIASGDAFAKGTVLTVETTPANANYKAGVVTVTGATLEGNTITVGSADFTVSAVFAEKAEAGIEWKDTEYGTKAYEGYMRVQGDKIVERDLPELDNPKKLTIEYRSDNTDVAEIDPVTGVITPKAEGYTTISAIFAGNDDYLSDSVSFVLTVAIDQLKFYVIGSFNDWKEYVPVYDTWYQFENLEAGDYELKVTTTPDWSEAYGYDALTIKHAGLSKNNDNGNICFTISNESSGTVIVSFEKDGEDVKTFTVIGQYAKPTFTVVGVEALVGFNWGDGLNVSDNEMAEDLPTENYILEKENVTLAAGDYEYQVAMNHDWRYGASNSTLTITESGIYNVTFTYVPSTGATSATADLIEPIVVLPTMKIAGDWDKADENKWNENALIVAGDEKTASYTATNLVSGTWYHFWIIKNGVYMSGNNGFDRNNLSADLTTYYTGEGSFAMYFQADQDGDYTFTWTYDTKVITMTFPYKEATALDNTEAGETAVKVMQNGQLLIIKNGKTYNAQGQIIK